MSSTKSSRKRTGKVSSDSALLSFDLVSNLTYMAALSTGDVPRDVIFRYVIEQPYKTAIYFKQVFLLTKKLGFEYRRSFQLVSRRAPAATVKRLLLRFAGSISSGESEHEFLAQEAGVEREQYVNQYQRSVETLQKWADAYAALLVSVSLIMVVAMISTMIYDIGGSFVFMLAGTMFIMSFFGAYIIYKAVPYEIKSHKNKKGPKERQKAAFLLYTLGPIGVLAALYLVYTSGLGLGLLTMGFFLMPVGIYASLDDSKVDSIDQEVSKFLRALGSVSESLGTTLSMAMRKLDRRSLGNLEPYIKRLQARLGNQINPKLCWKKFVDETGSELVFRSTSMFVDGIDLGGSPTKVGHIASDYAMDMALLRARRKVTAIPFAYLAIPLHGAMSALLIFVLEIMIVFNGKLNETANEMGGQSAGAAALLPTLPVFQTKDLDQISALTLGAVLVLTIANSLAPYFATGGHPLKLAFYGSIMCLLSGLNLLMIPAMAQLVMK